MNEFNNINNIIKKKKTQNTWMQTGSGAGGKVCRGGGRPGQTAGREGACGGRKSFDCLGSRWLIYLCQKGGMLAQEMRLEKLAQMAAEGVPQKYTVELACKRFGD